MACLVNTQACLAHTQACLTHTRACTTHTRACPDPGQLRPGAAAALPTLASCGPGQLRPSRPWPAAARCSCGPPKTAYNRMTSKLCHLQSLYSATRYSARHYIKVSCMLASSLIRFIWTMRSRNGVEYFISFCMNSGVVTFPYIVRVRESDPAQPYNCRKDFFGHKPMISNIHFLAGR
jgi:hypothetical protein